jgi:spermidine/putrescine transport system ATP-binding protein
MPTAAASRCRWPVAQWVDAGKEILIGVRPEKIYLLDPEADAGSGTNVLDGGKVIDASFTGVSTQYLVEFGWGQALTVFVQNLGTGPVVPLGTSVRLAWAPEHTFAVQGDLHAGEMVEDPTLDGAG